MPATPTRRIASLLSILALLALGAGCRDGLRIEDLLPPIDRSPDPFKAAHLPVEVVAGPLGVPANAAFGPEGDLLVAGYDTDRIFAVSRRDGSLRTLASGVTGGASNLLSVAWDGATVYAGASDGRIYAIDSGGGSTEIVALAPAQAVNGLAVAPSRYPSYGGRLVAVTTESAAGPGHVLAIDRADPSQVDTIYSDPTGAFVDLVFSRGGSLFVVDHASGRILDVTPSAASQVSAALTEPVGIAFDQWSDSLMVADASDDTLYRVAISSGVAVPVGQFDFRAGASPSGVVFDGLRNLVLMTEGSSVARGVIVPGFATAALPKAVPYTAFGFGSFTFDGLGALFGTGNGTLNRVFRIDRETGYGAFLVRGLGSPGEELLSIAYDPGRTWLYVGSSNQKIYVIDRQGYCHELVDFTSAGYGKVNGLALAPANYGGWGGSLIAVTDLGYVVSVDPADQAVTLVGGPANVALSAIAFAADGTLYAANHSDGSVVTIDPADGSLTVFSAGLGAPDGLAIDQLGTTLYVADSQGNTLWGVAIPGGLATDLGPFDFDDGPEPSGLAFDGLGVLLLGTGETGLTVRANTVFP